MTLFFYYSLVRNYNCHLSLEYHYCVLYPVNSSRGESRHVSWHTFRPICGMTNAFGTGLIKIQHGQNLSISNWTVSHEDDISWNSRKCRM